MARDMFICLTIAYSCVVMVSCKTEPKCDDKVIQCIKDVNGGSFPIHAWSPLNILWNRNFSIVWYSEPLVKQLGFTCITTVFGVTGATDTYHNGCQKLKDVKFSTKLSIVDKTFTINDSLVTREACVLDEGVNMKAYAIHFKKHILGLYVCSPNGVAGPHITIYCPTAMLGSPEVQAEIEEAKAKFQKCNINDGVATCPANTKCP